MCLSRVMPGVYRVLLSPVQNTYRLVTTQNPEGGFCWSCFEVIHTDQSYTTVSSGKCVNSGNQSEANCF